MLRRVGAGSLSPRAVSSKMIVRRTHGLHLSRAEEQTPRRAARDRRGHRARGGQGIYAAEQGPPARRDLQGAQHRHARAPRGQGRRQDRDQDQDRRVAEKARRGARCKGSRQAEGRAQPHPPFQAPAAQGDGLRRGGGQERPRMNPENVIDVTRLIQLAVAPVFLLTAVGTIIGVLSNRLGRAVDRSRTLEDRLRQLQPEGQKAARAELDLLSRRVRLVYGSIVLSVICALFVGLLIAVAFVEAFIAVDMSKFIGLLFIAAMLAFILSLLVFLREIFLAVSSARDQMR